jgi:hypothetical protein
MHPAMSFRLDDGSPNLAGDLRAEARTGDPAANYQDVELLHSCSRLRFGKP